MRQCLLNAGLEHSRSDLIFRRVVLSHSYFVTVYSLANSTARRKDILGTDVFLPNKSFNKKTPLSVLGTILTDQVPFA